jgi:hypothetical protein
VSKDKRMKNEGERCLLSFGIGDTLRLLTGLSDIPIL